MKTLFFLIYSSLTYLILLYVFGYNNFHILSIISLTFSLSLICIVSYFDKKNIQKNQKKYFLKLSYKLLSNHIIVSIIVINAIINVVNIIYISNIISFDAEEQKSMFQILPVITVLIAQIGGWFFQSILIFILAELLGTEKKYNLYLKIIGFAYIGFFLSSTIGFSYNVIILKQNITIEELKFIVNDSPIHIILGKLGEYITLAIASFLIYINDKFSEEKSLIIVTLPSILILSVYQFFSWYVS